MATKLSNSPSEVLKMQVDKRFLENLNQEMTLFSVDWSNHLWAVRVFETNQYGEILNHNPSYLNFQDPFAGRNNEYSVLYIRLYVTIKPPLQDNNGAELMVDCENLCSKRCEIKGCKPNGRYGPFDLQFQPGRGTSQPGRECLVTFQIKKTNSSKEMNKISEAQHNAGSLKSFLAYSAHIFQSHELSDVILKVKGTELPAHKVILAAASPVFKTMFGDSFRESRPNEVEIDDFESETISEMLKFIYNHKTPQFSNDHLSAMSLYEAAHKYDIQPLLNLCRDNILCKLNSCSVLDILILADTYDDSLLKKRALDFIVDNPPPLSEAPKYEKVIQQRPAIMMSILFNKCGRK